MREADLTPDSVTIEAPESQGRGGGGFRRPQLTVKDQVRPPPGLNMRLKTQNGEVRLDNVNGVRIEATTTNGGITGRGVSGAIEAQTVNGGITMDLASVTGDSRMVTVNGGAMLRCARSERQPRGDCREWRHSSAGRTSAVSRRAEPPASCRPHRKRWTSHCRADHERRRSTRERCARLIDGSARSCLTGNEIGGQRRQVGEIPQAASTNRAARYHRPGSLPHPARAERRLDCHQGECRGRRRHELHSRRHHMRAGARGAFRAAAPAIRLLSGSRSRTPRPDSRGKLRDAGLRITSRRRRSCSRILQLRASSLQR